MGVGGSGNFQNDSAADYIASVIEHHTDEIKRVISANTDGSSVGVEDTDLLMAAVEVIIALCEKCYGCPPKLKLIKNWKQRILKVYDEEIDGLEPDPDYKIERRQVISDTFDRLEKLSQEWHGVFRRM